MPEVLERAGLAALGQVLTQKALAYCPVVLPARVVEWSPPGPVPAPGGGVVTLGARAKVQVAILSVREIQVEGDLQAGETLRRSGSRLEAVGPYPIVPSVPVCYPGPRAFRIRAPLEVGETGALVVSTRDTKRWAQGEEDVDPVKEIGAPSLASAIFVPGLETGSDPHAWDTDAHLGPPQPGLADLSLTPAGAWSLDGVSVDVRAPSTSIGAVGPGVGLAKNAQMLAIWSAWVGGINALPPGPISDVELKALAAGLTAAIAAAVGTTSLTAE